VRLYISGAADAILDGRNTAAAMVGRGDAFIDAPVESESAPSAVAEAQ
jgi:small subunit ribosomal protein S2